MILIHGSWVNCDTWQAVVPGLSRSFNVLTYDRRGHSRSERINIQGSFDQDAEDAEDALALLTELELAPAHVVGNSAGAIIALKLATYRPSAIRSLVIHEPPLLNLALDDPNVADTIRDGTKRVEAVVEVLQRGDIEGGARQFVETIAFGPGAWEKLPTRLRETFVTNAGTWLDELKDPAGLSVDLEALSQFRKPTLVSYGGNSAPFFRPIVQKLVDTIPGSTIGGYQEDGHTPHISNPDEFVTRITAFA